jgi:putative DNA primase/helicase
MYGNLLMGSRGADNGLDEVLDAFLRSMPPDRKEEMRTLLRAAQQRNPRKHPVDRRLALTPDHEATNDESSASPHESPHAPLPAISPERAAQIAGDIILAATRVAAAPPTPPLALRTGQEAPLPAAGPGTPWVAVGVRANRHVVRLSDVASERLHWLWPGRVPAGKITLLDGDPGLGKSTLLCEVAARITRGEALPGGESGAPRGVLLFSAEDDVFDTIRPRIDAAGGDPQRIVSFVAVPDGTETGRPFSLPADLPLLDAVVQHADVALVIFDPLVAYLRVGVSANIDQNVRHALAALKASAERTGAAIVAIRHLNKSPSANPLYRGLGSIGIIGAARSGLLLAADPDDPARRVLAVSKGNLARPPASLAFRLEDVPGSDVARVVWEGESPWTAAQLLQAQTAADGDAPPSAVDQARAWLREALATGPRPAAELRQEAAAHGIGAKALYAARKAEGITTEKERIPRGRWLWMLTSTPVQDDEHGATPDT